MNKIAERLVRDVDVTLDLSDPDSRVLDPLPFTTSRSVQAQERLRTRAARRTGAGSQKLTLPSMPGINALQFTIRYLPGGRKQFLEFVKLAALNGDATAQAFCAVFDDLPLYDQKIVTFDDVAFAAGVKPSALMSAVVGHGMEAMTDMGNLVAAAFHPAVISAMGKSAVGKGEDAVEDRKAFLQGRGFLPTPKGASIHLHANASASSQAAAAAASDPSVPRFAEDLAALASSKEAVQRQMEAERPILDAETDDAVD